jgi:type I restriction enzyme M protein
MRRGVVSMPSNIFATTGTNVFYFVLDKTNSKAISTMDASKPSTTVKEAKNQTLLSPQEEDYIIDTFNQHEATDFWWSFADDIAPKLSLSAGQYFHKIEYRIFSSGI